MCAHCLPGGQGLIPGIKLSHCVIICLQSLFRLESGGQETRLLYLPMPSPVTWLHRSK